MKGDFKRNKQKSDVKLNEFHNIKLEKSIELLSLEYTMLNEELEKFHKLQHQNIVQALVAVGALLLYIGSSWDKPNTIVAITMTLILPVMCYVFLLSSMGLLVRNRIIRKSMVDAENKFHDLLFETALKNEPLKHISSYLEATKQKNAIVMRLDAGTAFAVLLALPIVSIGSYYFFLNFKLNQYIFYICLFAVCLVFAITLRFIHMTRTIMKDLKK